MHTVNLWKTFAWGIMKIFQRVPEIWRVHETEEKTPWIRSITLRLRSRDMDSAHRLTGGTFGSSLMKPVQRVHEIWSGHEIPRPWSVTLTLNPDSWERNKWVKITEHRSKGLVDMERAWNSRVRKSHDLEVWFRPWVSVAESWVLHTVSVKGIFGWSLMKIVRREQTWGGH